MTETVTEQAPRWRMSADEVLATREKLGKINARAQKRGFTGRWTLDAQPTTWSQTLDGGLTVTRHGFTVALTGVAPCYGGWTFLGAVDAVEGTEGFVLRLAPGVEDVDRTGIRVGECDHCRTARKRKQVMLVRHEHTGELKQVGSTCIRDFLGWDGSLVFLWDDAVERELGGGFSGAASGWAVEDVLAFAQAALETWGWARSDSWDAVPTKDRVSAMLSDNGKAGREYRAEAAPHVDAARELVPAIREALLKAFEGATDGYEANLCAILQPGAIVTWKTLGIAVSAVSAYARLIQRELERKAKSERVNAWQGEVGQVLEVLGTITFTNVTESYFGNVPTHSKLVIVDTPEGTVKTFTSAAWAWHDSVKAGERIALRGKIKEHETFQDHKSTVLTRCKRLDV